MKLNRLKRDLVIGSIIALSALSGVDAATDTIIHEMRDVARIEAPSTPSDDAENDAATAAKTAVAIGGLATAGWLRRASKEKRNLVTVHGELIIEPEALQNRASELARVLNERHCEMETLLGCSLAQPLSTRIRIANSRAFGAPGRIALDLKLELDDSEDGEQGHDELKEVVWEHAHDLYGYKIKEIAGDLVSSSALSLQEATYRAIENELKSARAAIRNPGRS